MTGRTSIALIGFGEAGAIIGAGLAERTDCQLCCYDCLLSGEHADKIRERAEEAGVAVCDTLAAAVESADWVISAVTAAAAPAVAYHAAALLGTGQTYLDINSVAPTTKVQACRTIEAGGARYIDVAVMAPVPPSGLDVPLLLAGSDAATVADTLNNWGMNARAVADSVGTAAAIKMCRSVMIKGLEALTLESLSTARHYGAEDAVLASLHASFPHMGWDGDRADYLISRIAEHGARRAAEMREVTRTVADAGQAPRMSLAAADTQAGLVADMQAHGLQYEQDTDFDWRSLIDALHHGH